MFFFCLLDVCYMGLYVCVSHIELYEENNLIIVAT